MLDETHHFSRLMQQPKTSPLRLLAFLCFFLFIYSPLFAQQDSLKTESLKPVAISVSKLGNDLKSLPIAVTTINALELQPVAQRLSFQEYLQNVPGLFSLNANNYSQDLRLSIRGFGARSAFGIRGIKIIVDGIPETTPDGQGQIDNLNLAVIKSIDVLRGPSSVLYGNASGGVITIATLDAVKNNFVKAGYTFGSFNMQQSNILAGIQHNNTTYVLQGNYTKTDGYREQSGFLNYNFNGKVKHDLSETSQLIFNLNYTDSPVAKDAGGLTLEEVNDNRRQARQRNVSFDTQETISQLKVGLAYNDEISEQLKFNTYGFYSYRSFYGKLPFENGGIVDLDRNYFGNGASLTLESNSKNNGFSTDPGTSNIESPNFSGIRNELQIGYDIAFQNDRRVRFQNMEGTQADESLNQLEQFQTFGVYALDQLYLGKFLLRGGLRYDYNLLKAKDAFLSDGDNSDELQLNALSASLNSSYNLDNNLFLYGGISTSFETPALSELSANPNGEAGFNTDLEAQRATNYEIGAKYDALKTRWDVALFYIKTTNDLVPFELEQFPDRTFFRNAGSTNRKGIELALSQKIIEHLEFSASYTFSDFEYEDYTLPAGNFSGNSLPGIPKHLATASVAYNANKLTLQLNGQFTGSFFADDANETRVEDYTVINVKSGYEFKTRRLNISPFLGINNLFNTSYNDNIRLNAFGNRYYEPAPGFNAYVGMAVKFF